MGRDDKRKANLPAPPPAPASAPVSKTKIAAAAAIVLLAGLYWALSNTGLLGKLTDEHSLRRYIEEIGALGPLVLILVMTLAIVISPIPSGPIAMAAGAAYGPFWGMVYVVIGAEAGAMIAFLLGRWLGYEAVRRWSGSRDLLERLSRKRSQNWLMLFVFGSRLVPFISFDAVSYAAGLTPLSFFRFALATAAGIVPASFLLAYFGEELSFADSSIQTAAILLLGTITLLPIAGRLIWTEFRRWKRGA